MLILLVYTGVKKKYIYGKEFGKYKKLGMLAKLKSHTNLLHMVLIIEMHISVETLA